MKYNISISIISIVLLVYFNPTIKAFADQNVKLVLIGTLIGGTTGAVLGSGVGFVSGVSKGVAEGVDIANGLSNGFSTCGLSIILGGLVGGSFGLIKGMVKGTICGTCAGAIAGLLYANKAKLFSLISKYQIREFLRLIYHSSSLKIVLYVIWGFCVMLLHT